MKLNCPDGWELVKLGDLGEVNRGRSRHRPRHAPHLYGGAYPFIQTGDIKASGGRITTFQQTYSEAGLAQSRLWDAGTLCITIAANIAETGILQFPACFPDSVIGFVANPKKCDVQFIEYTFRNIKRLIQHAAKDGGTVQDNINLGTFETLRFPIPKEVEEQRAIARILGALDDKIFLNQDINHTLEAMAQSIFKSWFVDFDPVTAKAAGLVPAEMNMATAALFPARFVESELGLMPEGWRVGTVANICTTQYGYTASSTTTNTGTRLLRVTDMNKAAWIEWQKVPYCAIDENALRRYELKKGDVLVSRMADPGKAAIVEESISAVFASYLIRLATQPMRAYHLFYFLRSDDYKAYAEGATSGTVQENMNARVITACPMVIPPEIVTAAFHKAVVPLRQKLISNIDQNHTLAALRDSLLPQLLSGEIRVGQAEKVVAEAV